MGGAVSITPVHDGTSSQFHKLLEDSEAISRLYAEISVYGHHEGKINLKNNISLPEMLLYIENGVNPILKEALPNCPAMVIKTAYEFVDGKKGNHELNKKEFSKFLPVVYLFYHLWKIFDMADASIDDRRIFPNEFLAAKYTIESIPGVHLTAITREEWEQEFHQLDKNKDGHISFREFCKYVVTKIITPKKYMDALKQIESAPSVENVPSPLIDTTPVNSDPPQQENDPSIEAATAAPVTTLLTNDNTNTTINTSSSSSEQQQPPSSSNNTPLVTTIPAKNELTSLPSTSSDNHPHTATANLSAGDKSAPKESPHTSPRPQRSPRGQDGSQERLLSSQSATALVS